MLADQPACWRHSPLISTSLGIDITTLSLRFFCLQHLFLNYLVVHRSRLFGDDRRLRPAWLAQRRVQSARCGARLARWAMMLLLSRAPARDATSTSCVLRYDKARFHNTVPDIVWLRSSSC